MKTAIVYYSRTGNTRTVATLLEQKLKERKTDVDLIEIEAVKKPGLLTAGSAARAQKELPIKNTEYNLEPYDTLVVGAPIWGGRPSPFIKTFFNSAKNTKGRKAALFVTGMGPPESHENARGIIKTTLEQVGIVVADVFLDLRMKKGSIVAGEQEMDDFLEKV